MDIKVNARLSAYSKVNSIGSCNHGVVTESMIGELFEDDTMTHSVSTNQIDSLFSKNENQEDTPCPPPPEHINTVSFSEIDSLFRK